MAVQSARARNHAGLRGCSRATWLPGGILGTCVVKYAAARAPSPTRAAAAMHAQLLWKYVATAMGPKNMLVSSQGRE